MRVNNTESKKDKLFFQCPKINIKILILGIFLFSIITFTICWYCKYRFYNNSIIDTSITWQQINTMLTNDSTQQQLDIIQHFSDSNDNNYGMLASLGLACFYANKGNYIVAEQQLQKALRQTNESNFHALINIRLAQLKLQQGNIDSGLKILNSIKQNGWIALVEDIRGDAQMSKGDYLSARAAYEKVLKNNPSPILKSFVRMKLNNLPNN